MDVDDTLSEKVADAIRARLASRRRRGLAPSSGKELAASTGMSQSGMSARLTGATPIDLNDLEKIARALGVEVSELLPQPALRDERPSGQRGAQSNRGSEQHRPNVHPVTASSRSVPRPRDGMSDFMRRARRVVRHPADSAQ